MLKAEECSTRKPAAHKFRREIVPLIAAIVADGPIDLAVEALQGRDDEHDAAIGRQQIVQVPQCRDIIFDVLQHVEADDAIEAAADLGGHVASKVELAHLHVRHRC